MTHAYSARYGTLLLLLTLTFALPGCKPWRVQEDPAWRQTHDKVVADPQVVHFLRYQDEVESRIPGVPMEVTVPVRLAWPHERHVQYRYLFFDAAGVPLDADPGWRFVELPPRRPAYLQGTALSNEAEDWTLEIRVAR